MHFGDPFEIQSGWGGVEDPFEVGLGAVEVAGLGTESGAVDALGGFSTGFTGDGDEEIGETEGSSGAFGMFGERLQIGEHAHDDLARCGGTEELGSDGDPGEFGAEVVGVRMGQETSAVKDIDEAG